MAVVQFFSTDSPESVEWRQKNFGILCFVRDPNRKSYYFRLYCPIRHQLLWEHEMYNGLQYQSPAKFFHCFEAEVKLHYYRLLFLFSNKSNTPILSNKLCWTFFEFFLNCY